MPRIKTCIFYNNHWQLVQGSESLSISRIRKTFNVNRHITLKKFSSMCPAHPVNRMQVGSLTNVHISSKEYLIKPGYDYSLTSSFMPLHLLPGALIRLKHIIMAGFCIRQLHRELADQSQQVGQAFLIPLKWNIKLITRWSFTQLKYHMKKKCNISLI